MIELEVTVLNDLNTLLEKEEKSFEDIANEIYEYFHTFIRGGINILISSSENKLSIDFSFEEDRYPEIAKKAVETILVVLPSVDIKLSKLV